jgi:RHH-type proline utilization regulon transcriptional repressor/proline dehydrogenase/delta 1-pyrroline-5-carboxylate dehydrogenase
MAIAAATRLPEPQALAPLLDRARLDPQQGQRSRDWARQLIEGLRREQAAGRGVSRVQALMQAYSLSSQEGVALMCLAEALLRIPDPATRDALIRDKIARTDWQTGGTDASPLFVHAAAWGLLLTGRLLSQPEEGRLPAALRQLAQRAGGGLIRMALQWAMELLGEQFIAGRSIAEALERAGPLQALGFRYSYDMLGEAAVTQEDARRYFHAYVEAIEAIGGTASQGPHDSPGISIKLSALHPRYCRAQYQSVMSELRPRLLHLALLARRYDIGLNIDAEESERLELSLELLEALCFEPRLADWHGLGFVVQAYSKRCPRVIDYLVDLARRSGHRLMLRLVKGAYWDSEIKRAQVEGQSDYPVYTRKHHTDVSYLACARQLLEAGDAVYPQFATHNAMTLAAVHEMAQSIRGEFKTGQYEFQCLHGMGESLYRQVVAADGLNRPCRVYAPVGTYETLLAYLVRRLLENGANTSFVHQVADVSRPVDELLEDPVLCVQAQSLGRIPGQPHEQIPLPLHLFGLRRLNSQGLDFSDEASLQTLSWQMAQSVQPLEIAPKVAGHRHSGEAASVLLNPADPSDVIGTVRPAGPQEIEQALQQAQACDWSRTAASERASVLERAADLLHAEASICMGLLVREAGKTWPHAAAEVREAQDFLRYYAGWARSVLQTHEVLTIGPVACISPWNFPLAIFVGQVAAALAAGNPVLAKPAEQTPAIAARAVDILWRAGVPREAMALLPGPGPQVGMSLVRDPRVCAVMFTGSTATAKLLQAQVAQRLHQHGGVVPLIAETGGQNCMVVDSSALIEQVVQDAVASAFEAAGQRCSALRVLCVQDDIADVLLSRLKGAMSELRVGPPAHLHTDVGPLIDARACRAVAAHVDRLSALGRRVWRLAHPDSERCPAGHYLLPTLIEIESLEDLEGEVFGPVLHFLRWPRRDLSRLLEQIHRTGFALTLGVQSRDEALIEQVVSATRAGNVYVNRTMVGAVVGVQPFGGEGLSGTGPKAGGPLLPLRLLSEGAPQGVRPSLEWAGACQRPPQQRPALRALHHWAQSRGLDVLAQCCERFARQSIAGQQVQLAGPTGETNTYLLQAPEHIACRVASHESRGQDLLIQLAAVFAVGSRAELQARDWNALGELPYAVRQQIHLCQSDDLMSAQIVLLHANPEQTLALHARWAAQPGPIIRLVALLPGRTDLPLHELITERCMSVNTAAAGGNTTLMTL